MTYFGLAGKRYLVNNTSTIHLVIRQINSISLSTLEVFHVRCLFELAYLTGNGSTKPHSVCTPISICFDHWLIDNFICSFIVEIVTNLLYLDKRQLWIKMNQIYALSDFISTFRNYLVYALFHAFTPFKKMASESKKNFSWL